MRQDFTAKNAARKARKAAVRNVHQLERMSPATRSANADMLRRMGGVA